VRAIRGRTAGDWTIAEQNRTAFNPHETYIVTRMNRRTYLTSSALTGVAVSLSGCLSVGPFASEPGATDDVVLETPDRYEDLREARDSGALVHPIHADPLPEAEIPAPLHDREISTREFVGDRHVLMTFIFTRCPNTCQLLTQSLRQVQADSIDEGYADDVALLPTTFDPANDTPAVLEQHGEDHGVNWEADNWFYLRPDGPERAREVVDDTLGIEFQRLDDEQREERDLSDDMKFLHTTATYLANADGYVERAYTGENASTGVQLLDDVETLRERW
jgi:protein SCO1/2